MFFSSEDLSEGQSQWRIINVLLGGILAYLASFVAPIKASIQIRYEIAKAIRIIDKIYTRTNIADSKVAQIDTEMKDLFQVVYRLRMLSKHAIEESNTLKERATKIEEVRVTLRKIGGVLELMSSSRQNSTLGEDYIRNMKELKGKEKQISERCSALANQLEDNQLAHSSPISVVMSSTKEELEELITKSDSHERPLSPYVYLWLHKQLGIYINELEQTLQVVFEES